jgi:hypothetical protein
VSSILIHPRHVLPVLAAVTAKTANGFLYGCSCNARAHPPLLVYVLGEAAGGVPEKVPADLSVQSLVNGSLADV